MRAFALGFLAGTWWLQQAEALPGFAAPILALVPLLALGLVLGILLRPRRRP
jgi:hypothetical protein